MAQHPVQSQNPRKKIAQKGSGNRKIGFSKYTSKKLFLKMNNICTQARFKFNTNFHVLT